MAEEELKKPLSERVVASFGSVVLNSPGHREAMLERSHNRRETELLATQAKEDLAVGREIRKARRIISRETLEAKRIETENTLKIQAQEVYDAFENDVQATIESSAYISDNVENNVLQTWTKYKVSNIKSAYQMFVLPTSAPNFTQATRKNDMVEALRNVFNQKLDDLDIYEEDIIEGIEEAEFEKEESNYYHTILLFLL